MRHIYEWNGKKYPTMAAVAQASGTSIGAVFWHLDNHGNLNGLGKGLHHTFRPVVACGVPFRSISRFAAFIGRSTSRVHYRLNAGDQDWIDRQYEAARRRVPG